MKKLVLYLYTTGQPRKKQHLRDFGEGAAKHSVQVIHHTEPTYVEDSDYGMIFGFKARNNTHHKANEDVRLRLYDAHLKKNIFLMDSDVLQHYNIYDGRANVYHRYPYGSIYPNEANYFLNILDKHRWAGFNIPVKDYKEKRGSCILLLLNRGIRGFSSFGQNSFQWALKKIGQIKRYTDRPILIRPHNVMGKNMMSRQHDPNDDIFIKRIRDKYPEVEFTSWEQSTLEEDLKRSWVSISFTSTASAVSLIEGVPIFVDSPVSYMYEFSSGPLSSIEKPKFVDREPFYHKYSNSHWSKSEIIKGEYWNKIKDII